MKSKDLGKKGEQLAVEALQEKNYEILHRNWRYLKNEVDIIARKDNFLVFVEVKTRSSLEFGLPQEFVKPAQIKRLVQAANAFVELTNAIEEIRFDIIAISKQNASYDLLHIENAFLFI